VQDLTVVEAWSPTIVIKPASARAIICRITFATQLGADERGATIASHLEGEGVSLAEGSVSRIGSATSVATSTLDASGQAAYSFELAWELPRGHPPEGLTHVHTGSIAATLEPGASAVLATIEGARPGATISYDLNVRPSLMGEPHEVRAKVEALIGLSDVVKASDEDIAWLYPDLPPLEAIREMLDMGPTVGLLTRGPNGALVVTRTAEVAVPAPRAKVVDTIGAGDAFGGGFLAWWSERALTHEDLGTIDLTVEATAFACLVAARTCSRPGANPPHRSELPS